MAATKGQHCPTLSPLLLLCLRKCCGFSRKSISHPHIVASAVPACSLRACPVFPGSASAGKGLFESTRKHAASQATMMGSALHPRHSRLSCGSIEGGRGSSRGAPAQAVPLPIRLSCQEKAEVSSSNLETNSPQLPTSVCHPVPCLFPELLLFFMPSVYSF